MPQHFTNRVILVTGGTGALGTVVTRLLLARGAQVVVTYIKKDELDHLSATLSEAERTRLTPFHADVTNPKAVKELVDHVINQFHRVDGLANLVGGYAHGAVTEITGDQWTAMLNLNLTSTWLMTQAVLPTMRQANYGRIVAVGARGALDAQPRAAHYNVSKVGAMWLMTSVAHEYSAQNITANSVLPSTIDTPANRQAMPTADVTHWVRPDEVAELICYLLAEESSGTSGAQIPVYGKA